jgi:sterol desaturase/sphingolipid hydroxylase (fatty acid hydroxylase superfamily)
MDILNEIIGQLRGFFGIGGILKIMESGDYRSLLTYEGVTSVIGPVLPILLVIELVRGLVYRKFDIGAYRIPFLTYLFNSFLGRFISFGMVLVCIGLFERHAPFTLPMNAWGFLVGYVAWEFAHFIYHFLAHKVRLFWCLHSTHHAPEHMNLFVSHAHFFLEAPYADVIRTTICILLGVPPPMLFVIMFIDGTWGSFIHLGDSIMRKADLGVVARNVEYMDMNYCNLLNVWDRVFGTYQPELPHVAPEYGITRKMKPNSFLDAYFGEIVELARDVWKAPGLRNKLMYIFMPPGWSHTGDHRTAKALKMKSLEATGANAT